MKKPIAIGFLLAALSPAVPAIAQENSACKVGKKASAAEKILEDKVFKPLYKEAAKKATKLLEGWEKAGLDPAVWKELSSNDYVAVPFGGKFKTVPVGKFLSQMEQTATCMALDYGADIFAGAKLPEEFAEWARSAEEVAAMAAEAQAIYEELKDFDPKKHAEDYAKDYLEKTLNKAIADDESGTFAALYADVEKFKDLRNDFEPIPVPSIPFRDDLDSRTDKNWKASFGSPENIKAEFNAQFTIRASGSEAQVKAQARGYVQFFGSKEYDVVKADYTVDVSNKTGFQAEGLLWVMGKDLSNGKLSGPTLQIADEQTFPLIDVYQKFWFSIGPIPVSVKVGASGSAGLRYSIGAAGVAATAELGPTLIGDAYGEAAVDVVIARVGIGGVLHVINASANLRAWASINFDGGHPTLVNGVDCKTSLTLLSGELFGFAELSLPPPLFQRFEQTLYRYDGIRKEEPALAVNFEKHVGQGKIAVMGDADHEDLIAADLDTKKTEVLEEIDLELRKSGPQLTEETRTASAILAALEANVLQKTMDEILAW